MIKFLKIVCLVLLLIGCKNNKINKPEKPENLISKDKMTEILYDMALISSAKGSSRRVLEAKGVKPQDYIFSKHNIDSMQFVESNNYYSHDIDLYEELYNKVKSRLELDKANFNAIKEREKTVKDSISKENAKLKDSLKALGQDINGKQIKNILKRNRQRSPLKKTDSSQISTHQ